MVKLLIAFKQGTGVVDSYKVWKLLWVLRKSQEEEEEKERSFSPSCRMGRMYTAVLRPDSYKVRFGGIS